MGITSYAHLSPLLLKCSLLVSAQVSYGMGEKDIEVLTEMYNFLIVHYNVKLISQNLIGLQLNKP